MNEYHSGTICTNINMHVTDQLSADPATDKLSEKITDCTFVVKNINRGPNRLPSEVEWLF